MKTPYTSDPGVYQGSHSRPPHLRNSKNNASAGTENNHMCSIDDDDDIIIEDHHITGLNSIMKGLYDDLDSVLVPSKKKKPLFDEILQHLRDITAKMKRNIKREAIQEEWKMVAKVIDRCLLIIFLIAIITLTLSILYIYPIVAVKLNPDRGGLQWDAATVNPFMACSLTSSPSIRVYSATSLKRPPYEEVQVMSRNRW